MLSILIVNYNSSDFIRLSLYALSKLTKNHYQVFILDNNSRSDDYQKLKKEVKKYSNVVLERSETRARGSEAHAEGLNYLVKKVNTSYFCILDADATWLIKNWDEILISRLKGKTKVIGTEASHPGKSQGFPYYFAVLFETKALQGIKKDFSPGDIYKFEDTGYKIRNQLLKRGYRGELLKFRNTRDFKKGPFRELVGVGEYYLMGKSHIFASHFGRGSTLGLEKYQKGFWLYFYSTPLIGKKLALKKGFSEKKEWLKICRGIIGDQI